MRILFAAARERDYERNEVLLRTLQSLGSVDIVASYRRPRSLIAQSLEVAAKAFYHLNRREPYDLFVIGFYGYLIARLLAPVVKIPILFDAFVSNFDTLSGDRQQFRPDSFMGHIAHWLDYSTCNIVNQILIDTQAHRKYFVESLGISSTRIHAVPVSCHEGIFSYQPMKVSGSPEDRITQVLYYCTFLPLHGADVVVKAMTQIQEQSIQLRLIGQGSTYQDVRQLAKQTGCTNVTFVPPLSRQLLAKEIAQADICLGGHFGSSAKANRVIPGKIYQMLAVGRPVIAADTQGNRELLQNGVHALLIQPSDPDALAQAIRELHTQPDIRNQLASLGHHRYVEQASEVVVQQKVTAIIQSMLA
jgi:glycosyltransferase involved in cell wall biosynthesis